MADTPDKDQQSEAPTAKRKADAARDGDVLQARELAVALVMAAGAGWLAIGGPAFVRACTQLLGQGLQLDPGDLAQFDLDKNGWIDEGDAVYSQLSVWSGKELTSLKERGVGALYTAAVDAPFSLKTESNQLLGQIRSAGIYLSETGEVGHLQQVDLAVSVAAAGQEQPAQGEQLAA